MKHSRSLLIPQAISMGLILGCVVEPVETMQDQGPSPSHSPVDSEWYNACHGYCAQMYDEPEGCDEDLVEVEETACHFYCNLGTSALTEPCRAALIDAYECVINELAPYACENAEASPQPSSDACSMEWDEATNC